MSSIESPEAQPAAPRVTRIVVLGTGTGVGKTWVSGALAEALRRRGAWVVALKPIETGVSGDAGSGAASDGDLLARASSQTPLAPRFTFPDPVSPAPRRSTRRAGDRSSRLSLGTSREQENEMTSHVTSFADHRIGRRLPEPARPRAHERRPRPGSRARRSGSWSRPTRSACLHDVERDARRAGRPRPRARPRRALARRASPTRAPERTPPSSGRSASRAPQQRSLAATTARSESSPGRAARAPVSGSGNRENSRGSSKPPGPTRP